MAVIDPYDHRTTFEYDRLGRRIQMSDPNSGTRVTRYNAFNEIRLERDANGRETRYVRDQIGRPQLTISPDGVSVFTWDAAAKGVGLLSAAFSGDEIATEYEYDMLSRPQQTTVISAGERYSIRSSYDSYGRLATLAYPEIDGHGRLTLRYEYTNYGDLLSIIDDSDGKPYWTAESRLSNGSLHREKLGNDVRTTRVYSSTFDNLVRYIDTEHIGSGSKLQFAEYE